MKTTRTGLLSFIVLGLLIFSIAQNMNATSQDLIPTSRNKTTLNANYSVGNGYFNATPIEGNQTVHITYGFQINTTEYWEGQVYVTVDFYSANQGYLGSMYFYNYINATSDTSFQYEKDIPSPYTGPAYIQVYISVIYTYNGAYDYVYSDYFYTNTFDLVENFYFTNLGLSVSVQPIDYDSNNLEDAMMINITLQGSDYPYSPTNDAYLWDGPYVTVNYFIYYLDETGNSTDLVGTSSIGYNVFYDINKTISDEFVPYKDGNYLLVVNASLFSSYYFMGSQMNFWAYKSDLYFNAPHNMTMQGLDTDNNGYQDVFLAQYSYYAYNNGPHSYQLQIDIYKYNYGTGTYDFYYGDYAYTYASAYDAWNVENYYFFPTEEGDYRINITVSDGIYYFPIDSYMQDFYFEATSSQLTSMDWLVGYYSYTQYYDLDTISISSQLNGNFDSLNNTYYIQYVDFITDVYYYNANTTTYEYDTTLKNTYNYSDDDSANWQGDGYFNIMNYMHYTASKPGDYLFSVYLLVDNIFYGEVNITIFLNGSTKEPIVNTYITNYYQTDTDNDGLDDALVTNISTEIYNFESNPKDMILMAMIYIYDTTANNYVFYTMKNETITLWDGWNSYDSWIYFNETGDYNVNYSWFDPVTGVLYPIGFADAYGILMSTTTTSNSSSSSTTSSSTTTTTTSTDSTSNTETTSTSETTTTDTNTTDTNSTSPPPLPLPINPVSSIILPFTVFGALTILRKRRQ